MGGEGEQQEHDRLRVVSRRGRFSPSIFVYLVLRLGDVCAHAVVRLCACRGTSLCTRVRKHGQILKATYAPEDDDLSRRKGE